MMYKYLHWEKIPDTKELLNLGGKKSFKIQCQETDAGHI